MREKKMAHLGFDCKMREIQDKRRLIVSHREGLKEDFIRYKHGGSVVTTKFRKTNSKLKNN